MKAWKSKALPALNRLFAGPSIVHRYKSCERKVRYSKKSAIRATAEMAVKTGENFDAYECDYCKGWHVGHSMTTVVVRLAK